MSKKKFMLGILVLLLGLPGCVTKTEDGPEPEPQSWVWQSAADYGGAAVWFARAFTINGLAFMGTGYDESSQTTAFWQYDPAADAWARKADFPGTARGAAVGFAIGEKGYIGLGYGPAGQLDDLWEYDPQSDHWLKKASLPGLARDHSGSFVIGASAYILGGMHGDGGAGSVYFTEVWAYDPQADLWSRKADLPEAVTEPACFVLGGKGYMGTGTLGSSSQLTGHFWEYDPQIDRWTSRADFPGPERYGAVGFAVGNRGFFGTGLNSYTVSAAGVFRDIWEYDAAADSWTKKAALGGNGRGAAVAFVLGSTVYVGSGVDSEARLRRDFWRAIPGQ